jgi:aconitase B
MLKVVGVFVRFHAPSQGVIDIAKAFTPQMEFIKAGGSYAIVFGKNYKLCF